MQNKFESNFTHKLYKKKLEEIRKFHRSIAKFKKIFKMKNEEFDNLSDKRFKDIVDAYKRNHPMPADKKSTANAAEIKQQENWVPKVKRAKSQCFDDLDLKEKRLNIYDNITDNNNKHRNLLRRNKNVNNNKDFNRKKIHFAFDNYEAELNNKNDNYDNKNKETENENNNKDIYEDEGADDKRQESIRRYQSLNKNNIHLFDFNSHPSKFFNQN